MEEKIKAEFKKYGLDENDEKLIAKIKVDKEEQIEEAVRDFAIDYFAERKYDQRMAKALATQKEKLEEEWNKQKTELEEKLAKPKEDNSGKDMPKEPDFKQVIGEYLKPYIDKIETLSREQEQSKISQAITAELEKAQLPADKFARFVRVEKIDDVHEAVDGLKKEIDSIKQSAVDQELKNVGVPPGGKQPIEDSIIKTLAENDGKKNPKSPGVLDDKIVK